MKEITGDIWDYHDKGNWIVVTTNGTVKKDGTAVMGRGIALQAKQKFPDLPKKLGELLKQHGNKVFIFGEEKIITLPTKNDWANMAKNYLIEEGVKELATIREDSGNFVSGDVYMVRPGCGYGGLQWADVKSIIEKYLDDSFIIVENKSL